MKTALPLFCALFLSYSSNGCSSPNPPDPPSIPVCGTDPVSQDFVALNFNSALGPGLDVPFVSSRLEPVAQAVAGAPWNVLCLDEVWTDEARDTILSKLALPDDHLLMADTRGQNEDPADRCAAGELDEGLACMRANCSGLPDEDVTSCAADKCKEQGFALYFKHPHCLNCVVASAGMSADQIEQTCNGAGASRMYGGRNGVILASRKPLRNTETIQLPSSEANRVGLYATVDVDGSPVEVACTHLSAAVDLLPPTDKRFSSWDDEMKAQLHLLSDHLNLRANGGPSLLLGDLNTGPSYTGDMQPDAPKIWDEVKRLAFADPASTTDPSICSRCQGSLIAPTEGRYLIDHVLTRGEGMPAAACAAQAFDAPIQILDSAGLSVTTNMSDHYAIRVGFSQ